MKRVPPKANSLPAAYFELTKPSITFLILVSTALGYYLGAGEIDNWSRFFITLIGSGLVSSGAGALNHFAEQESDQRMNRTKSRPIPTGMISPNHAMFFGIAITLLGVGILFFLINELTAILALITTLLYLFIYTPLKKNYLAQYIYRSDSRCPSTFGRLGGSHRNA